MSMNLLARTIRSAVTVGALATVLLATPSPAHAGFWSWWENFKPSWWSTKTAVATPEIDAGLARTAAAIAAGGLLVLRSRRKRQG